MSNNLTPDNITIKQRRLAYRARHRGMREMDYLFSSFVDAHLHSMSEAELDEFEKLLEINDQQIYDWYLGRDVPKKEQQTDLLMSILNHRITL